MCFVDIKYVVEKWNVHKIVQKMAYLLWFTVIFVEPERDKSEKTLLQAFDYIYQSSSDRNI